MLRFFERSTVTLTVMTLVRSFISLQLLTTAKCELMPYGTPLPQYLKCAYVVSLNTPARVIQDQLAVIHLAGQAPRDGLHAWA